MPKICYKRKRFSAVQMARVQQVNSIVSEYQAQGFSLSLRQVYYQFVARDLLPNSNKSYTLLSRLVSNGRLAGLIDWEAVQDRSRYVRSLNHWNTPSEIIEACGKQYRTDHWEDQKYRPEVWVEKDALIGIVEQACRAWDVPCFSCRGYTSQTEMWNASQRMLEWLNENQIPIVFHLGDHDPSGIDMSRDIQDRLGLFLDYEGYEPPEFQRLALNMDQVEEWNPPPNPAKVTDSRARSYIIQFGESSWELDALEPRTLVELIDRAIEGIVDEDKLESNRERDEVSRKQLMKVARDWEKIVG